MNNSIDQIRTAINNSHVIAIAGHTNPDGDAISACCALAVGIKKLGKKVFVLLEEFSDRYNFIPGRENIIYSGYEEINADLFISLDCGDKARLGESTIVFDKCTTLNVDHHISNNYYGDMNYVDVNSSSASEIVFRIVDGFVPLDKNMASAIYTGIVFDTGGFKHSSTTPVTMAIASELLTFNIPFTSIFEKLFYNNNFCEIKLLGRALEKSKLIFDNKIIYSFITKEEIEELNGSAKELGGIVGQMKSTKDIFASVFFYEKSENEVKVSFRSEDDLNVCEIAEMFGGGGHKKASGCTINGSVSEAIEAVLNALKIKLS